MRNTFELQLDPSQSPKSEVVTGVFDPITGKLLEVLPSTSERVFELMHSKDKYEFRILKLVR